MDVTQHGPSRHSTPLFATSGTHEIVDVEMLGGHVQLPLVVLPRVARTVCIDLDAESVRIGEIYGFADKVIRHPGIRADLRQMRDEASKRCAVRQQNREMVKTEQASLRHGSRAGKLVQMHDLTILPMRTETRCVAAPIDHSHSENFLVERDRSVQIRDL